MPMNGIFIFSTNFSRTYCKHTEKILVIGQTPHHAASNLGLHCLPMSCKKDARHILVNMNSLCRLNCLDPDQLASSEVI